VRVWTKAMLPMGNTGYTLVGVGLQEGADHHLDALVQWFCTLVKRVTLFGSALCQRRFQPMNRKNKTMSFCRFARGKPSQS
jgi:hypothetical protein